GASFTQRTVSSISVGGSINLEGFLSSILLSVVIIVTVVIIVVILIVVVDDGYVDGFLQSLRLQGSNVSFNALR
ncbi:hypothetical protein Tco_1526436, partial [Tanacetum coccineum]